MMAAAMQFIVAMILFSVVEGLWPSAREHRWWRRSLLVDVCGWLVHPLVVSAGVFLAAGLTPLILGVIPWAGAQEMRAHVHALSPWLQVPIAVIVLDFLYYWMHRCYHRFPILWAFHVIHHTSEELDWLATVRVHPVSQFMNTLATSTLLIVAGLPVSGIFAANGFIGASELVAHANVRWSFGSLGHVLVSPLFHQWHHARPESRPNHAAANFGAALSIWDRMFGTWSVPFPARPKQFGVNGAPKATLFGLILHPLRAVGVFCQVRLRSRGRPYQVEVFED